MAGGAPIVAVAPPAPAVEPLEARLGYTRRMLWWCLTAARAAHDPIAYPSLGAFDAAGPVTIDTAALTLSDGSVALGGTLAADGVAVFSFDALVLDQAVVVTGTRPVALLSRGTLVVSAALSASAAGAAPGAGGGAGAPAGGGDGAGAGGGRGSPSFPGGGGGFGGAGGDCGYVSISDGLGGPDFGDLDALLVGGSGGGSSWYAAGGGGGGAIELGADGPITLAATAVVSVDGAAGGPYATYYPGGGGGAGGGLLIHGVGGRSDATLLARGGPGGAGQYGSGGGGGGRVIVRGLVTVAGAIDASGGAAGAIDYAGYFPSGGAAGEVRIELATDLDGDTVPAEFDCDDRDPLVYPGATEAPCNGVDDDCDPGTGDGDCETADSGGPTDSTAPTDPTDPTDPSDPTDLDQDGFGVADGDCDDHNDLRFPGNPEAACNGIDDDCDEATPDGLPCVPAGPTDPGCGCRAVHGSAWLGLLALGAARRRRQTSAAISSGDSSQ